MPAAACTHTLQRNLQPSQRQSESLLPIICAVPGICSARSVSNLILRHIQRIRIKLGVASLCDIVRHVHRHFVPDAARGMDYAFQSSTTPYVRLQDVCTSAAVAEDVAAASPLAASGNVVLEVKDLEVSLLLQRTTDSLDGLQPLQMLGAVGHP